MKTLLSAALITLIIIFTSFGQGALAPSAAPAETMKTLSQVEPRIPIPGGYQYYTISNKGSYYLTTNMYRTLNIDSSDVTLDLMGYTIDPSAGAGISISNDCKNVVVRNGIIKGAETGVDSRYTRNANSRFEDLLVSDCGYCGMYIGSDCIVENCMVISNDNYGIQSSSAGKLEVRNCRVIDTAGDGIEADDDSIIVDNTIEGSGGIGLQLDGTGCYVANNIVRYNADNYDLGSDNQLNLLLCEIPETLDWPCSVKFNGTLSASADGATGITVNADNITIDLDGHAMMGSGSTSGHGIYQPSSYDHLTVRNGTIQNWLGMGRYAVLTDGTANLFEDLAIVTNTYGFNLEKNNTIRRCTVMNNNNDGIQVTDGNLITECTVVNNYGHGMYVSGKNNINNCVIQNSRFSGISGNEGNIVIECVSENNGQSGIYLGKRCVIKNCTALGNDDYGIRITMESTAESCNASSNGQHGIYSEYRATMLSCQTSENLGDGIHAGERSHIKDCTASYNNDTGIWAYDNSQVSGCYASFGNATGIYVGVAGSIKNCYAANNDIGMVTALNGEVQDSTANENYGDGINVGNYSVVTRCTAFQNSGDGIEGSNRVHIVNCTCNYNGFSSSDGAGIHVTGSSGVIDGNTTIYNDRGIDVDDIANLIINNRSYSDVDYDIVADNKVGEIVIPPYSAAITGHSGGSGMGSTDPWVNFAY